MWNLLHLPTAHLALFWLYVCFYICFNKWWCWDWLLEINTRRRKWQPTPVLLAGKFHRQRSLIDYFPWGHKELDTAERLHFTFPGSSFCSVTPPIFLKPSSLAIFLVFCFLPTSGSCLPPQIYQGIFLKTAASLTRILIPAIKIALILLHKKCFRRRMTGINDRLEGGETECRG